MLSPFYSSPTLRHKINAKIYYIQFVVEYLSILVINNNQPDTTKILIQQSQQKE
jgi:hypothetical protein